MLRAFRKGAAPSADYELPSGRVSPEKLEKMLWCLSEASDDIKREVLRAAEVIQLTRDERHSRLHIRFSCINDAFEVTRTYLGQSRGHSQDALSLADATQSVLERICTARGDPPRGVAMVAPQFDHELYEHIRLAVEALAVDSASNETVSATDMSVAARGLTPNLKWILRDAAHCARRLLGRLWAGDSLLSDILGIICQWRDSIGQLIQHSFELRQMYAQCCAEAGDAAVTTEFATLRAAKHRIETFSTPLSRAMLNPTGLISFAVKLTMLRRGERAGDIANRFLRVLSVEFIIIAAMMADAGLETLSLIRTFDTENLSSSTLASAVSDYLSTIEKHAVVHAGV